MVDTRLYSQLLQRDGDRCFYCGWHMWMGRGLKGGKRRRGSMEQRHAMTLEHLVANADGGTYDPENLVLAGAACNNRAGTLTVPQKYSLKETWFEPTKPDYAKFFSRRGHYEGLTRLTKVWIDAPDQSDAASVDPNRLILPRKRSI